MTNETLRAIEYGSGPGFCYDVDRTLFRSEAEDGPLVIALDSNIVADTMMHGSSLIDDEPYPDSVDPEYAGQLDAWAQIIELWIVRDVRFITLPGMRGDQRKPLTPERAAEKDRRLRGFEDALTFQLGDWTREDNRFINAAGVDEETTTAVQAVLSKLDARLVLQAAAHQVDAFLTRDDRIVKRMGEAALADVPAALRPTELLSKLERIGVAGDGAGAMGMFLAGHVDHEGCAYAGGMPFGDTGKWVPLLQAIEDTETD